jgi:hypothetical protein
LDLKGMMRHYASDQQITPILCAGTVLAYFHTRALCANAEAMPTHGAGKTQLFSACSGYFDLSSSTVPSIP